MTMPYGYSDMNESQDQGGPNGGYCIEIYVNKDGSMSVSSEPSGEEEQGEPKGTPVKSIGEAMKVAMDIYENDGQLGAGEEEFNAGYGGPVMRGPAMREGQ